MIGGAVIYFLPITNQTYTFSAGDLSSFEEEPQILPDSDENEVDSDRTEYWQPLRVKTPDPLYAIYMTSWVAGTPSIRSGLVELIKDTKLNAVVIDIKDETGRISFEVQDPYLREIGSQEVRIRDLREFIKDLNEAGIYVIGRVSIFQDPHLSHHWPAEAVRSKSGGGISSTPLILA